MTTLFRRVVERARGFRTLARFGAASALYDVATMAAGLVCLRWVVPEDYGLWQSLLLIQSYAMIVQAGITSGLNRELPYRMGKQDESALEMASTAQVVAVAGAGLLVLAGLVSLLIPNEPRVRFVLPLVFFATALNVYQNYLVVTYRADAAFESLAKLRLVATGTTIVSLPLVYVWGYAGLALRFVLLAAIATTLNHLIRPLRVPLCFSRAHFVSLLKVGVPLFSAGYLLGISATAPRVTLLAHAGVLEVGLFAPASALIALFMIVPSSIAQYIYPYMSRRLGRSGDPRSIWPISWKTSVLLLIASAPIVAVALPVLPHVIAWFFPRYVDSLPALKWAVVSGGFLGASISVNALFSLKAWTWIIVYTAVRVGGSFLLTFLGVVLFDNKLEGAAAGYATAQALAFGAALCCIYRATHAAPRPDQGPAEVVA